MGNDGSDFKCVMCYNCTAIVAEYHVKKPFIKYDHLLCHYCEWEIKEMIYKEGQCRMFSNHSKIVTLTENNIKDKDGYYEWLDKCTPKNSA